MKNKLIIVGCCVAIVSSAFAKKVKVVEDCAYCTGNISYIEDDPTPVPSQSSTTCYFCGSGSSSGKSGTKKTYWTSATSRSVNVSDGEYYVGTATIKTGKYSSKKGTVKVSVSFKMKNGKKYSTSSKSVAPDENWSLNVSWQNVKGIGDVELSIGIDGSVVGNAGEYDVSIEGVDIDDGDDDIDDGEVFEHGEHVFSAEVGDYELDEKYELLYETVPESIEIFTSNSKKWDCGKAASIKYKKFKEDGETWYELVGLDDEEKTNYSGLKLSYDRKKGTFKGSFTVYATNEGSIEKGKPKLKKFSFSVSGKISGSVATGVATCKKLKASWVVTID